MRARQRIRREHGHHADDWLITYADTITLLLCLFVIILTIRAGDKAPTHPAVKPVEPTPPSKMIFAGNSPFPVPVRREEAAGDEPSSERGAAVTERDPEPPTHAEVAAEAANPRRIAAAAERPAEDPPLISSVPGSPETPQSIRGPIAPAAVEADSLPAMVDRMRSQGAAVAAETGERITTLRISSATFFGSGSATLSGPGKSVLRDVASTLKSAAFDGFHISIEGHTDDTPISTAQFQSNWELSTARAAAVVRFLLVLGVARERLTAAGYADTFPLAPNRNADGMVMPENQAKNRRVVIKLRRLDQAERRDTGG